MKVHAGGNSLKPQTGRLEKQIAFCGTFKPRGRRRQFCKQWHPTEVSVAENIMYNIIRE